MTFRRGLASAVFLLAAVAAGCGRMVANSSRAVSTGEDASSPPETHPMADAWVLRLRLDAAGVLQAETLQPPRSGCVSLVLPAGDESVWIIAVDSTCTGVGAWGPFPTGHVAGGFGAPAFVLATSLAAERARTASPQVLQLIRGDVDGSARAHLYRPPQGDFVVVESGPTRVIAQPSGRTRAVLHYQLAGIGFSASLSRWAGIRSDEYALNRVVILDATGQVLQESIVTKATYDAGRVFGGGRWVDWIGTSPRGEVVRVVAELAGPAVRTAVLPAGWEHRTASPNGLYVLARDGTRLVLYQDTHPDLPPAIVWVRDELATIQDEAVRNDGMVAYHVLQRRTRGEPALVPVSVAPDGRERGLPMPLAADARPRPGLHFADRWLIEGLRAPLEPATGRIIVAYDLQA